MILLSGSELNHQMTYMKCVFNKFSTLSEDKAKITTSLFCRLSYAMQTGFEYNDKKKLRISGYFNESLNLSIHLRTQSNSLSLNYRISCHFVIMTEQVIKRTWVIQNTADSEIFAKAACIFQDKPYIRKISISPLWLFRLCVLLKSISNWTITFQIGCSCDYVEQ